MGSGSGEPMSSFFASWAQMGQEALLGARDLDSGGYWVAANCSEAECLPKYVLAMKVGKGLSMEPLERASVLQCDSSPPSQASLGVSLHLKPPHCRSMLCTWYMCARGASVVHSLLHTVALQWEEASLLTCRSESAFPTLTAMLAKPLPC